MKSVLTAKGVDFETIDYTKGSCLTVSEFGELLRRVRLESKMLCGRTKPRTENMWQARISATSNLSV
jgi:hypothetical protein